jgi:hypothetical protein
MLIGLSASSGDEESDLIGGFVGRTKWVNTLENFSPLGSAMCAVWDDQNSQRRDFVNGFGHLFLRDPQFL